jgi:hypothetical protein
MSARLPYARAQKAVPDFLHPTEYLDRWHDRDRPVLIFRHLMKREPGEVAIRRHAKPITVGIATILTLGGKIAVRVVFSGSLHGD